MAAGHHICDAEKDSELYCILCILLRLSLNAAFHPPQVGYSSCGHIQMLSLCSISLHSMRRQPKQAGKAVGAAPTGTGPRDAGGAGTGHKTTAALQLPRSISGLHDQPQIWPCRVLAERSCLQSITSWRGK